MKLPLVLASGSPYRRELLGQLQIPFTVDSPQVDETPRQGETPDALVRRLGEAKARAVGLRHPAALVIGSDQVATLQDHSVLTKPLTEEGNVAQLMRMSGAWVRFVTSVCLLNTASGVIHGEVVNYDVEFRRLNSSQIRHYVRQEKAYDCAGGFKAEGLGIALFASHRGPDPTALIGLPLITLTTLLHREGVTVLAQDSAHGA